MDTVRGYVEHITFRNEENGYTVLSLSDPELEKKGLESVFTAVGSLPEVGVGELLELGGSWSAHPVYGEQFKISSFEIRRPEDTAAVERYLGSGMISGVREALAHRIVKTFGEDTLRILDEEPERLAEIKGISKSKARDIAAQLYEKRDLRDGLLFLAKYHIPNTLALKIWKQYGPDIYSILRENPYKLADDVRGIGFRTADEIAAQAGIPMDSRFRINSAILYTLENASAEGSLYLPRDILIRRTKSILGFRDAYDAYMPREDDALVPEALEGTNDPVGAGILDLAVEKKVILKTEEDESRVYTSRAYYTQMRVARMLLERNLTMSCQIEEARMKAVEAASESGYELDERQLEAVALAQRCCLLILTGGPGTGKTTTINTMIRVFEADGLTIELAAPTGRAAKRMTEATGRRARTIHRLLEVSGDPDDVLIFNKDMDNPLDADVIIVDEMSMVDLYLFQSLLRAVVPGTRLIMVGDADQLPSVGPGRVLRDMIASGQISTVTLKRIFRQALQSDIVVNAHKINEGVHPVLSNKSPDFFFIRQLDPGTIIGTAIKLVRDNLPRYLNVPGTEIQVMAPMKKGVLGVNNLNRIMQEYLNPASPDKDEYTRGDTLFREGDRVMQVRNNYQIEWIQRGRHGAELDSGAGVFNGDMGILRRIDSFSERLTVVFDDDRYVEYEFGELDQLELSYAVTIHKAQGSEYPAVVIPLLRGPRMLMNRNLLYTAITRARRIVVLIGDPEVMNDMIDNTSETKRYTGLDLYMRESALDTQEPEDFNPGWIDPDDPFAGLD
ncbi:MAG: ATP-dependent RecD-like DNA helicase [Lachnospiraceae bacterium]|nr:ATP-dependent RecD-like DNA helicase [Lachnospiraceae bacterium]